MSLGGPAPRWQMDCQVPAFKGLPFGGGPGDTCTPPPIGRGGLGEGGTRQDTDLGQCTQAQPCSLPQTV